MQLQLQNAITQRGYGTWQACLFGGTALVLLLLAIVLWLHFTLRTKTKFRWQWCVLPGWGESSAAEQWRHWALETCLPGELRGLPPLTHPLQA